jgi:molybdopterin-guanine dinucleotide biosynthesis protein A
MRRRRPPIGVVLAGGRGRRIGGSKATVELSGKPLISYSLEALSACVTEIAIVAKADTELPDLPGVTVWVEPDEPYHPLTGLVEALGLAGGRSVLACAADMPFVTPSLLARLAETDSHGAAAVVPVCDGRLQPFPGLYAPRAAALLVEAARRGDARLSDEVAAIEPLLIEVDLPEVFFNVNSPDDLLQAAGMLDQRGSYPNVKS